MDPDFAADFLRLSQEWNLKRKNRDWHSKSTAGLAMECIEPFRSFMCSECMAKNATRLVDRKRLKGTDVPLRHRTNILILKSPRVAGSNYH